MKTSYISAQLAYDKQTPTEYYSAYTKCPFCGSEDPEYAVRDQLENVFACSDCVGKIRAHLVPSFMVD